MTVSNKNLSILISFICGCMLVLILSRCKSSESTQAAQQPTSPVDTPSQVSSQNEDTTQKDEKRISALQKRYKQELQETYQFQANEITSFYILAQRNFYSGQYESALNFINKALEIRRNADLLALKGNIYLGLGNTEKFVSNWKQALKLDETVPLPLSENIIEVLQNQGLINENLRRDF